jgi:hypothetical protein
VLCGLSNPAQCHEETVTTSDFAQVSLISCPMAPVRQIHRNEVDAGLLQAEQEVCITRKPIQLRMILCCLNFKDVLSLLYTPPLRRTD